MDKRKLGRKDYLTMSETLRKKIIFEDNLILYMLKNKEIENY